MAPREDREEREQRILNVAKTMIAQNGFLDLKISELAKEAQVSVGTLYVHFPSKEDLLIGVAMLGIHRRHQAFKAILTSEAWTPDQKLAGLVIADQFLSQKDQAIKEVESLCMMPSIWKKASELSYIKLDQVSNEITDLVKNNVNEGIKNKLFSLPRVGPKEIGIAAMFWSMALGLQQAFDSYCTEKMEELTEKDQTDITLEAILALSKGLAPQESLTIQDLKKLHPAIQNLVEDITP